MNKDKIFLFSLLGILVVASLFYGLSSFSVIGELNSKPVCVFESETGGSCTINMTLPEYRQLSSHTIDLKFSAIPGTYTTPILASPYWSGSYYEEWDKEETSSEEGYGKYWVYLYRIPSSWTDVYDIKVKTDTTLSGVNVRHNSADLDIDVATGHIGIPLSGNPPICTSSSCSIDEVIKTYRRDYRDNPDEQKFSFYHDVRGSIISNEEPDVNYGDPIYNGPLSEESHFLYDESIPQNQYAIFVDIEAEEDWKGYTDYNIALPPKTYLSYAKKFSPEMVSIKVGDIILQAGINNDTTSNDMSSLINNYCSRETDRGECIVPITFTSTSGGKITITGESADLFAVGDYVAPVIPNEDPVIDEPSKITGDAISFQNFVDFRNYPLQSYGLFGFILIIGLVVIYYGMRGKQ